MARGWRSEYGLYVCLCGARYCRVGMGGRAGACVWCLWVFERADGIGFARVYAGVDAHSRSGTVAVFVLGLY